MTAPPPPAAPNAAALAGAELLHAAPARRWDLLAFGNPCADIVLRTPALPAFGAKALGEPVGLFAGGTECNVACAVARLGRPAAVFGRIGGDAHAPLLTRSFAQFGVDTTHLVRDVAQACACAITMIDAAGERAIVYLPMPGADAGIDEHALELALHRTRLVYVMPYELPAFEAICRAARRASTLVAIDIEAAVAPDPAALQARIAGADIVFFNEDGFRAGTGEAPGAAAMDALLEHGPRVVVVSRGAAGAMAVDASGFASQPAFPADVADTTGAGDTFNAAFLVALMDGLALAPALRFACAAASCTVVAMGARSNLPDHQAVDALVAGGPAAAPGATPC